MTPEPFTLHVPDEVLDDLRVRLERTRWPDEALREAGVELVAEQRLRLYRPATAQPVVTSRRPSCGITAYHSSGSSPGCGCPEVRPGAPFHAQTHVRSESEECLG
jgi:hypothetical protein